MRPFIPTILAALVLAVAGGAALDASAADVHASVSTRETYVGLPVTLSIQIDNATKFDPPTVPEIPGLRIQPAGEPSRSTQFTIINGATSSRSSVTYSYAVTPLQPGSFRIPAISIQADGQTLATRPFEFVASKSETGDLLFVEITGKEKQIYVGQSLGLTLKIWVRPYHDQEHNLTLSEADMWQLLSERTNWGPFAERIEQLADNNQRPVGTEVLRKDRDGASHSYYLYEIDATIYPKKPGRIAADDVHVVVLYPTALGQSRDPFASFFDRMGGPAGGMMGDDNFFSPFGSRLTVESVRPVVADAKVEPIDVLEIPIANRPADYRGAVGKYIVATKATPTDVKAGDPITLTIGIAGTGPMDLVQAPPLAELPALAKDFKVPNEPLAGYSKGAQKVFSTTIRPRQAGITEIPAIPFTYFDPEVGKFMTAKSDPITIHVEPADTLALDAIVGHSKAATGGNTSQEASADADGPILANFTGDSLLVNQTPPTAISRTLFVLLALPPLVVLVLIVLLGQRGFALVVGSFRSASRKCQAQIESATRPAEVGVALRTFLARRLRLRSSADATTIVGALRSAGYRNLAVRTERLLAECDADGSVSYAGQRTLEELKTEAIQTIGDLESESRHPRPQARPGKSVRRRIATTTALVAIIVGSLVASPSTCTAAETTSAAAVFSPEQQQTLLAEANDRYQFALDTAANDSAEAKQAFADAAEKYQLVVDSGVSNGRLYFNLANAQLESGATCRAIANYRRSLRLDPTDGAAQRNLAYAEKRLGQPASDQANPRANSFSDYAEMANRLVNRFVSPTNILAIAISFWVTCWLAVALRLFEVQIAWKTVAVTSLLLAVTAGASYALTCQANSRNEAVVVATGVSLRAGDGESFASVSGNMLHAGEPVEWLKQRGDWVQVRTAEGQSGWLPNAAVEIL